MIADHVIEFLSAILSNALRTESRSPDFAYTAIRKLEFVTSDENPCTRTATWTWRPRWREGNVRLIEQFTVSEHVEEGLEGEVEEVEREVAFDDGVVEEGGWCGRRCGWRRAFDRRWSRRRRAWRG